MDNIIQVKRLHNAKIYGERRLLHDLHVVIGILKQLFLGISSINCCTHKQPPEMFFKILFLKTSQYSLFTGKHLCWSLFLIRLYYIILCYIKKRL